MIQLPAGWQEVWNSVQHIAIAYLLTASIGWESERVEPSAGVRTFPVVGIARCG